MLLSDNFSGKQAPLRNLMSKKYPFLNPSADSAFPGNGNGNDFARPRANSSLSDMAFVSSHEFNQPSSSNGSRTLGGVALVSTLPNQANTLEATVRNLVEDKYTRDYKLDKKTRSKALEILKDFYAKNHDDSNVSVKSLFAQMPQITNI